MNWEYELCEPCPLADAAEGLCTVKEGDEYPAGCPKIPVNEREETQDPILPEDGFHMIGINIKNTGVTVKMSSSQFKEITATLTPGYSGCRVAHPDQEELEIPAEASQQNDYMYTLNGNRALLLRDITIKSGSLLQEHKFLDDEFYDEFNAKLSKVILNNMKQILKTVDVNC